MHRMQRSRGLVARMAPKGIETILGVTNDPVFGPVVMFGLGGNFTELFTDVTFRLAPFDAGPARRMMREIKAMALEQGRGNITANAVAPGFTETEMTTAHPNIEKIREAAIRGNAVPRVGQPEDIAAAVTFLASEHGRYITGETLHVTGGRYG